MQSSVRYFIITYTFSNRTLGTGTLGYIGPNYPNLNNLKEQSKVENFNPMSIVEVSEEDYMNFWK